MSGEIWETSIVALPNRFALDWRRLMRWCLLGTAIMFLWLMAPVVKCTFTAFQATPLGEVDQDLAPSQADAERVEQGQGFVAKVTTAAKVCYQQTPLLGQESWKGNLLLAFAAATVITWALRRWDARRRKTFDG